MKANFDSVTVVMLLSLLFAAYICRIITLDHLYLLKSFMIFLVSVDKF